MLRAAAYEAADAGGAGAIAHGMQCRAMMVVAEDADFGGAAAKGEWHEGRCYAVAARKVDKARGWPRSLYRACSVVWYEQDADTLEWYIVRTSRRPRGEEDGRAAIAARPPTSHRCSR